MCTNFGAFIKKWLDMLYYVTALYLRLRLEDLSSTNETWDWSVVMFGYITGQWLLDVLLSQVFSIWRPTIFIEHLTAPHLLLWNHTYTKFLNKYLHTYDS